MWNVWGAERNAEHSKPVGGRVCWGIEIEKLQFHSVGAQGVIYNGAAQEEEEEGTVAQCKNEDEINLYVRLKHRKKKLSKIKKKYDVGAAC